MAAKGLIRSIAVNLCW